MLVWGFGDLGMPFWAEFEGEVLKLGLKWRGGARLGVPGLVFGLLETG